MQTYRFGDVVRFSGATRNNLIHWTQKRVISPDIRQGGGPGRHALFSFRNIALATIATQLNAFSVPTAIINKVVLNLAIQDSAAIWKRAASRAGQTFDQQLFDRWRVF